MARPLRTSDFEQASVVRSKKTGERLDRSAARAFASAVSALIISTLVVTRSSEAIAPDGTAAGNSFESGTVSLVDDDAGRSLMQLADMGPNRPVEECISVSYEGTILPVDLTLVTSAIGDLDPYLDVVVEQGAGGGFDACDEFVAGSVVFEGTLAELVQRDVIELGTVWNVGDGLAFRFRFELQDVQEAVGREASVDFIWEATPR